jgi:DNA modification methylase
MMNLYNKDCLGAMKHLPANTYDLAIIDPPYGIGEDGSKNHSRSNLAKAKLEMVECRIATFEEEFLSYILTPNGKTVGETIIPQINENYATGKVKQLMLE